MRVGMLAFVLMACGSPEGATDGEATTPTPTETPLPEETPAEPTPEEVSDPCLVEPTVLRLGTGREDFQAVADGEDVFIVHGGQAEPTWHVELAVELENTPDTVVVGHTLYRMDGTVLSETTQVAVLLVPEEGVGSLWSCRGGLGDFRAVLNLEEFGLGPPLVTPWEDLCGVEIRAEVTVSRVGSGLDDLIELASASKLMRLQPDPCDCASCGVETPECPLLDGEGCPGVPFVKYCERDPDYCPITTPTP